MSEKAADLCARCATFDLDRFLQGQWTEKDIHTPVAEFTTSRDEIASSPDCSLCRALLSVAATIHDVHRGERPQYVLYAIPSLLAYRAAKQPWQTVEVANIVPQLAKTRGDAMWLVVRKRHVSMRSFFLEDVSYSAHTFGCLAMASEEYNGVGQRVHLVDREKIDFRVVRGWLDACVGMHGSACNSPQFGGPASIAPGLQVINCKTRELELALPDCVYCALSYVWGPVSEAQVGNTAPGCLPNPLPQTIEDAARVCLEFGFTYIWVDRYCIPQEDGEEKRTQIQNMHKIYNRAVVTIIAAAGESPSYGLPGISRPRQSFQESSRVGTGCLVSTGRNLESASNSKWSTRAWTFQEGLLARRMLVFTEEQVYFKCDEMECRESIDQDLNILYHVDDETKALKPHKFMPLYPPEIGGAMNVVYLFNKFVQRQLTFENDALNAMLGILEAYQDKYPSLRHIWGQPVVFEEGYSLGDMLAYGLSWPTQYPSRRRKHFPSWSWTGWTAGIQTTMTFISYKPVHQEAKMELELRDGTLPSDAALLGNAEKFKTVSQQLTQFIHIEGDIVDIQFQLQDPLEERYTHTWHPTLVGASSVSGFQSGQRLDINERLEKGDDLYQELNSNLTWKGLALPEREFVLVLKDKGDHYERIGTISLYTGKELLDVPKARRRIRLG